MFTITMCMRVCKSCVVVIKVFTRVCFWHEINNLLLYLLNTLLSLSYEKKRSVLMAPPQQTNKIFRIALILRDNLFRTSKTNTDALGTSWTIPILLCVELRKINKHEDRKSIQDCGKNYDDFGYKHTSTQNMFQWQKKQFHSLVHTVMLKRLCTFNIYFNSIFNPTQLNSIHPMLFRSEFRFGNNLISLV